MSLLPYYLDIETPFSAMEKPVCRKNDFFDFNRHSSLVPEDFFRKPHHLWQNVIKPMEQLVWAMTQLGCTDMGISGDEHKFQVNIDVQHFSPNEISVKVIDRQVVVEGKHEEQKDQHGYVSRQFVRKYVLPDGCLPDAVQSTLSSDGVLMVTCPKVLPLPSPGETIVPITKTGPVQKKVNDAEELISTDAK